MVDIWSAFLEALQAGTASSEHLQQVVEASKDILAAKDRASYLGEWSLGHIDPGT